MNQYGDFTHLVHIRSIFGCALNTFSEEIDPHRLPVSVDQIEHQRGAIGVARLGKTIELKFGHRISNRK